MKEGNVSRQDPSKSDTSSFDYAQQAVVLEEEALHDGGDVAIYATGQWFLSIVGFIVAWKWAG